MPMTDFYPTYDGQGNMTALFDETGTEVLRCVYTAFGERLDALGDTSLTPFQWNGRWGYYYDEDLGEYHVRARPYGPAIVRWLAVDPIVDSVATCPYRYCRNGPLNRCDESGSQCTPTPPYGYQHLARGSFGPVRLGEYVPREGIWGDWVSRIGSTLDGWWTAVAPFPQPPTPTIVAPCCCDNIGIVQVLLYDEVKYYLRDTEYDVLGPTPHVDGAIPYAYVRPTSALTNVCLPGAERTLTFFDQPNAPLIHRSLVWPWWDHGFGVIQDFRLQRLIQRSELCVVCLGGCEGPIANDKRFRLSGHEYTASEVTGLTTYGCFTWSHEIDWVAGEGFRFTRQVVADVHSGSNKVQVQWIGGIGDSPSEEWKRAFREATRGFVGHYIE